MIYYDLGPGAVACSTNIGDAVPQGVVTPEYQAHGCRVAVLPAEGGSTYGVDALITDLPGLGVGVRTADCVPLLLYDPRRGAAGAVHSGWKGTVGGISQAAVAAMTERFGCAPADIRAVVGPCIHLEAFEVGDEVYEAFAAAGYGAFCRRMRNPHAAASGEKWHVDLPGVCARQLSDAGVGDVFVSPLCTYAHADTLYSYRRHKCLERIVTSITLLERR